MDRFNKTVGEKFGELEKYMKNYKENREEGQKIRDVKVHKG